MRLVCLVASLSVRLRLCAGMSLDVCALLVVFHFGVGALLVFCHFDVGALLVVFHHFGVGALSWLSFFGWVDPRRLPRGAVSETGEQTPHPQ